MNKSIRRMKLGFKRFWDWVNSIFVSVRMRAKNDAEELLKSVSERKNSQKQERKPINVWRAVFVSIISLFAIVLVIPMGVGIVGILFQGADFDTITPVSQESLTGLILVATALGALTLWFAGTSDEPNKREVKHVGKTFLFAALALSVFMLLSPLLLNIRLSTDAYSNFLKYTAVIFLLGGSVAFANATLLGLFQLWKM